MRVGAELRALAHRHRAAAIVFPVLATVFLFDVLILDRSLSGFDIILSQPNWQAQFGEHGTPNRALADSPTAHFPQRRIYWELQRRGHTPSFNPYIFSGVAAAGQGVGAFLTSLPQLWLDTPDAIDWSTWIRLILAGLFMYALLLRFGTGRTCAIFGGIAWTYNLHQIVWLEFPQHLATQLWLPLLVLVNLRTLDSGFRREPVLTLVVVNVLFYTSGYTQIVLYGYLFVAAFNTVYLLFDPTLGWGAKFRAWLLLHGVYVLAGIVLSAAIWFDTHEINASLRGTQSFRSGVGSIALSAVTLLESIGSTLPHTGDLIRLLAPNYHGGLWGTPYRSGPHGNLVEGGVYFGALMLACLPFSARMWRHTTGRRLFLALAVPLAIFVAMEHRDPLVLWLINRVPFIGFGHYGRSMTLIVFTCCILGALGLHNLRALFARGIWRRTAFAVGAVALLPIAVNLLNPSLAVRPFAFSSAVLVIATIGIVVWGRRAKATLIVTVFTAITAVELFVVSYAFNTRMPNELIFPVNRTIRPLLQDQDAFRVAVVGQEYRYRPNILAYYGLPTVDGYSTLVPHRYLRFARETFGPTKISANGILYLRAPNVAVLRALNVKYVISDQPLELPRLELVDSHSGEWLYRVADFLPRVYCADFAARSDAAEQSAVFTELVDTRARPLVGSGPLPYSGSLSGECNLHELRVYTNGLSARIDASGATYAIMAYGYSRQWRLRINGQVVEPIRVNGHLLAIPLSAGAYHLELRFRSTALAVSAGLQIVLGLVVVFVGWRRRSPRGIAFAILGVVLIGKNALTVYPVRNDEIAEQALRVNSPSISDTPGAESVGPR